MNMLLKKASQLNLKQRGNNLTHGHLLFLLQKNKNKFRRLMYYLKMRDASELIRKKKYGDLPASLEKYENGTRIKACLAFFQKKKIPFDLAILDSDKDPIIVERNKRRYVMANDMNEEEYVNFAEQQTVSFYQKNEEKDFRKWLLANHATNLIPTNLACEIINYLARETVAQIVEASLLLKKERHPDWYENLNDIYNPHSENSTTGEASGTSIFEPKIPPCNNDDPITPEVINAALSRLYTKNKKKGQMGCISRKPRLLCI